MEKLIPQNGNVVCTRIACANKTTSFGFIYKSDDAPLYKVEAISNRADGNRADGNSSIDLSEGDLVRVNSTGTCVKHNGIDYYIFNLDNIVGKVKL